MFGVTDHNKNNTTIHIGDTELNQVGSTRYLGILIDYNLNYEIHINDTYRKLIKFTSIFTMQRLAKRGICRRRVSVCVCVCHTPVLYQNC